MVLRNLCAALILGVLTLFVGIGDADAKKRLGGGGNSGMQRQSVTPASPQAPAAAPAAAPRGAAAPAPASPGRSWMGIAGGLLTGALIGGLLFGSGGLGSFMGMFLNLLIFGAIVFFIMRWWRNRSAGSDATPALAGAGAGGSMPMPQSASPQPAPVSERTASGRVSAPQIGSALGGAVSAQTVDAVAAQPVEKRIPADFDVAPFVREAKKAFMMLQAANDRGDVTTLRNFMTAELAKELAPDIMKNAGGNQHVEVVTLDASVLEVVQDQPGRWLASVHFSGQIREEAGQPAETFDEVWHVTKPTQGGSWLVAGIQQIEGTTHAGTPGAAGFGHQPGAR
jgi:predicted lipid-binding transport protein (Tim44 family)